jgi:hypothetical protein
MATKKTKRKSVTGKGSSVVKRAAHILQNQKSDYKRIFKEEIRKGGDSKTAAKRAGSVYRDRYGATASKRWKNALQLAKKVEKK